MTQEERQLLLKDLCARSYYWPKITPKYGVKAYIYGIKNTNDGLFLIQEIEEGHDYNIVESIDEFKVYLRPMSSMTEEEIDRMWEIYDSGPAAESSVAVAEYLYERSLDCHHLIEKGLALEAPEGMYNN